MHIRENSHNTTASTIPTSTYTSMLNDHKCRYDQELKLQELRWTVQSKVNTHKQYDWDTDPSPGLQ